MEQQKLPNATTSLILGILSFVCCCFSMGIGGVVMSGIAFFLTKKDEKTYLQAPQNFSNYSQLKTAKIIAIIGLVLGVLTLAWSIFSIIQAGGWAAMQEQQMEMLEQWGFPTE